MEDDDEELARLKTMAGAGDDLTDDPFDYDASASQKDEALPVEGKGKGKGKKPPPAAAAAPAKKLSSGSKK